MDKATFGAGCYWGVESFFCAEEYHQRTIEKNGLPSCHVKYYES
jgi:peptide methionine sulfoxide reductase MsrA